MSSMNIAHFPPIGQQTWPPHPILVSDWSISKQSSPLKLLSHMNRNFVGSIYIYGRFCIMFPQSRMKGERHRLSQRSLQFSQKEIRVPLLLLIILPSVKIAISTDRNLNNLQCAPSTPHDMRQSIENPTTTVVHKLCGKTMKYN